MSRSLSKSAAQLNTPMPGETRWVEIPGFPTRAEYEEATTGPVDIKKHHLSTQEFIRVMGMAGDHK